MTGRVLVGLRGGVSGMWVSRPGLDVQTASEDDMLMSTNRNGIQIITSGVIYSPGSNTTHDFTIPDLGFTPLVLVSGAWYGAWTFPNPTTLRVHVYTYGLPGMPQNFIGWALTNQRLWH